MDPLSIGEVAQKAGLRASTIRYYERIGLLPSPERVSGRRRYQPGVFQKLGVIQMARQAGFRVAEIQALLHDFPENTPPSRRWQSLAGKKLVEIDALIEHANAMKSLLEQALQCRCGKLDECVQITENAFSGVMVMQPCCGRNECEEGRMTNEERGVRNEG